MPASTALLKLRLGELQPDSGEVRRGANVEVACYESAARVARSGTRDRFRASGPAELRAQPARPTIVGTGPVFEHLFDLPTINHTVVVTIRIVTAAVLGGVLGAEREAVGKAAGLRTHMLVALGAALFVIGPQQAGLGEGDLGRIIQGIAAGIGFIGAGTILKRNDGQEIQGLTTAASIWLTAAIGILAAVAPLWLPILGVTCAWVVLYLLGRVENRMARRSMDK